MTLDDESGAAEAPSDADEGPAAARPARTFLVVVDESEEMRVALHFACLRAKKTGGVVALLYVQEPAEFQHWLGVGELMQQERREQAEARLQDLSAHANKLSGAVPILYVREGDRAEELLNLLDEDESISIVVLGASPAGEGPGPIVSYLLSKARTRMNTPLTIVPGSLSLEEVEQIA
ncbi:MAG: universal stress protein [Alphaproteobacteria bacterium]|nr:universal stress protein [Alphaproteobacteria bacterium]